MAKGRNLLIRGLPCKRAVEVVQVQQDRMLQVCLVLEVMALPA
jgi:hypothetical protein